MITFDKDGRAEYYILANSLIRTTGIFTPVRINNLWKVVDDCLYILDRLFINVCEGHWILVDHHITSIDQIGEFTLITIDKEKPLLMMVLLLTDKNRGKV